MRNQSVLMCAARMRSVIVMLALLLFVGLFTDACHLPKGGRAGPIDTWNVTQFFCSGDPVIVSWNLNPGFDRRNCNRRCASPTDCFVGTRCIDGVCSNRTPPPGSVLPDGQCAPDTELTITSSAGGTLVNHNHDASGAQSAMPGDSVTFTANGGYREPLGFYAEERKTATMVTPDTGPVVIHFPFACPPAWSPHDIEQDGPSVSEHVAIARVINTSGVTIDLSGANHVGPPVRLRPGEGTTAFNGKLTGVWSAAIPPEFRIGLPTPRCGPTAIENPYPGLSVELQLTCSARN